MSKPPPIADIEALLVVALLADSSVTAVIVPNGVSTELPSSFNKPPNNFKGEARIKLWCVDSAAVDARTEVAHRPIVQIEAFGSNKDQAFVVINEAYRLVKSLEDEKIGNVSFKEVSTISGPAWLPDPDTDIPRYIMRFALVTRAR